MHFHTILCGKFRIFAQISIIMRAAIYGAGSLGTILGAFISKNGGQIDLINPGV